MLPKLWASLRLALRPTPPRRIEAIRRGEEAKPLETRRSGAEPSILPVAEDVRLDVAQDTAFFGRHRVDLTGEGNALNHDAVVLEFTFLRDHERIALEDLVDPNFFGFKVHVDARCSRDEPGLLIQPVRLAGKNVSLPFFGPLGGRRVVKRR